MENLDKIRNDEFDELMNHSINEFILQLENKESWNDKLKKILRISNGNFTTLDIYNCLYNKLYIELQSDDIMKHLTAFNGDITQFTEWKHLEDIIYIEKKEAVESGIIRSLKSNLKKADLEKIEKNKKAFLLNFNVNLIIYKSLYDKLYYIALDEEKRDPDEVDPESFTYNNYITTCNTISEVNAFLDGCIKTVNNRIKKASFI